MSFFQLQKQIICEIKFTNNNQKKNLEPPISLSQGGSSSATNTNIIAVNKAVHLFIFYLFQFYSTI